MGYIGKKPSDVPLTSDDIADNIITSSKIVDDAVTSAKINDGTIVNDDINDVAATKLLRTFTDIPDPYSPIYNMFFPLYFLYIYIYIYMAVGLLSK